MGELKIKITAEHVACKFKMRNGGVATIEVVDRLRGEYPVAGRDRDDAFLSWMPDGTYFQGKSQHPHDLVEGPLPVEPVVETVEGALPEITEAQVVDLPVVTQAGAEATAMRHITKAMDATVPEIKATEACSAFVSNPERHEMCCMCGWSRAWHALAARDGVGDKLAGVPQGVLTPPTYERPVNPGPSLAEVMEQRSAATVLEGMAKTFRERNAVYSDNYKMIAPMVRALFPAGVPSSLVVTDHWHLFELLLVKLARFASTNLTHVDSIHDAAIYAAMIESIIDGDDNDEAGQQQEGDLRK